MKRVDPRLNNSGEKGKSVHSGVTAEFVGRANSDMTVTKSKILISNVRANTRTEGAGHIDSKDFNGP